MRKSRHFFTVRPLVTVEILANLVVKACEAEDADYMVTGAFAYRLYGIPRSTKDVDVVVSVADNTVINRDHRSAYRKG